MVKLLVLTHGADPESYAVRKNEFPVIVRLPLYAAIKSGGSPGQSRPREPSQFRDVGRFFPLTPGSQIACEEAFATRVLCFFIKMSVHLPHPLLLASAGAFQGQGPTMANGTKGQNGTYSKEQNPTKILSLTGTRCVKGSNREAQPA